MTVKFDLPAETSPAAPATTERRKSARVHYKLTLSSDEHERLIALRDNCRSAGHSVSKTALLRAAIALINQQSSVAIAEQLQQLPSLKKPRKSATK